ncbi:mechanosensitive ion channel domain-containing protein [Falsirhodobacter halotolerans]|uniref:mechanosensitive ion channel domain-containing protein n=1 Tax=Falsirhodobacter halotolerans TaxID=1146892 RepID=UPI001FD1D4F5|nr:mechanosensitive ion channel domain-containing protein [Falsirhodobacter halotolerans]MCJ8140476.1 mechanosensitive ion channel [Falsirhodobacter halotolerans]
MTPFRSLIAALLIFLAPLGAMAQTPSTAAPGSEASAISSGEAVQRLLDVLQDDQARTALIERLQADEAATPDTQTNAAAPPPALAQQVAESTAVAGRQFLTEMQRVAGQLVSSFGVLVNLNTSDSFKDEALRLVMTIFTTIVIGLVLMRVAKVLTGRHAPPPTAGFWRRARSTLIVSLLRLVSVAVAWATGYALATFVFSDTGAPSTAQSLYLNAYLVYGVVRVILRAINSPNADEEPALSVLAPRAQEIIYRNQVLVAGIVTQGLLFLVPLARAWLGFAAVHPVRVLVATVAVGMALRAIRQIRNALILAKDDRVTGEKTASSTVAAGAQHMWQGLWPILALAYVGYAWFIAVTRPALIESVILRGTLFTFGALVMVLVGMRILRSIGQTQVRLPSAALSVMPSLAGRITVVVMILAWLSAIFLLLFAVSVAVWGWGWIDTSFWTNAAVQGVMWRLMSAVLMALIATMIWALVDGWIEYRLTQTVGGTVPTNRTRTLLSLFRNGFTIALVILATMITLAQLGINIAPLLAGAGVIGLAIGFGAQKLVQDVITGVFIQLENAINVGDVVMAGGVSGGVERVNIRTVRMRALDGSVHIVPFSSVDVVTNMTRDFGAHLMEMGVAYGTDIAYAKAALFEAYDRLMQEPEHAEFVTQPLEMQGVTAFGDNSITIRCRVLTVAGKHWGVGRRYNELVKVVFDERGIDIPFPQRTLHFPAGMEQALVLPAPKGDVVDGTAKPTDKD